MNNSNPIKICIIEDHEEIRNGIAFMINTHPGFHCKGCKSGEEALALFKTAPVNMVLMDIGLPGMDGIECTRLIKELYPDTLIMMCTVFEDTTKIFDALKAGASGYILKMAASETLVDAIKELLNGGSPMSSAIARKVVSSFSSDQRDKLKYAELTNKENEILSLLADGYGNKEIADRLFVSVNTVRTHVYHIYAKLHVRNRIEALNKIKNAAPMA